MLAWPHAHSANVYCYLLVTVQPNQVYRLCVGCKYANMCELAPNKKSTAEVDVNC